MPTASAFFSSASAVSARAVALAVRAAAAAVRPEPRRNARRDRPELRLSRPGASFIAGTPLQDVDRGLSCATPCRGRDYVATKILRARAARHNQFTGFFLR